MASPRTLVVAALLPALLACSALGACWMTFAAAPGHGCCEQAGSTSISAGDVSCSSMAVGTALPSSHVPEASAARPPWVAARGESTPFAFARVVPAKAPPLVLRI